MKYANANPPYVPELTGQVFVPTTDENFRLLYGDAGPAMKAAVEAARNQPKNRYVQIKPEPPA